MSSLAFLIIRVTIITVGDGYRAAVAIVNITKDTTLNISVIPKSLWWKNAIEWIMISGDLNDINREIQMSDRYL